jgi:hypothetical protein
LIINKSKDLVLIVIFISLLYDENTINNHGFSSIHMWLKVDSELPLLLSLQWMVDGTSSDNLMQILIP